MRSRSSRSIGKLDELAALLLEKETLDREQVVVFFSTVPKRAPATSTAGAHRRPAPEMFPPPDAPGLLRDDGPLGDVRLRER